MLLSTDTIARLVKPAGANLQTPGPTPVMPAGCYQNSDRRQARRLPIGRRTQILRESAATGTRWETILLQDISVKGVGLLTTEPLAIGTTFVLKLEEGLERSILIRCVVRRCEAGGLGGVAYHQGATFEQMIQHPPYRLNGDDGTSTPTILPDVCTVRAAPQRRWAKEFNGAVRRAAVGLFRWNRRRDDYSS